tara:strand:- start:497 stop:1177 length:681 start_codon:yes stop_codon:yes gene_type:complete
MKKYIYILFLFIITSQAQAHTSDYEKISKIEMEVFRNNKLIGYSNYYFEHEKDVMTIKNYTQFKVKLLGIIIFSISSEAIEKYQDNKLVFFKSNTLQNNKEKFVNLNYDKSLNKFIIDGSSFKGKANTNSTVGNWWNHKILEADQQISPLSGSIKNQIVTFVGKENIELYGKNYSVDHYKLKSKNQDLPDNKKLDFDIWINKKDNLILKVLYHRIGKWEYRLKSFE